MGKPVITKESQSSLDVFGILWQALVTTIRNGKVVLPVFLLVSFSFSLLALGVDLAVTPVLEELSSLSENVQPNRENDENARKAIVKDLMLIFVLLLLFLILYCVISLFFAIATIFSSSEAYTAEALDLKHTFLSFRGTWTAPIIASFYMIRITVAILVLFSIPTVVISQVANGSPASFLTSVASILGGVCYFYVAVVWMLSLVVAILENHVGGRKSITRARELIKGKRVEACAITLTLLVVAGALYSANVVMTRKFDNIASMCLVKKISLIWLQCLVKLFMFVVYTVFYHECKKSHDALLSSDKV